MSKLSGIIGFDVGGANVKAVRLDRLANGEVQIRTASIPLEIWRDPSLLVGELSELGHELDSCSCSHLALTLTAELCDSFRTKREGVNFICNAVSKAFPDLETFALDVMSGEWVEIGRVAETPLHFAANNWMASALHAAESHPDGLLIDVGSTTTDIIPLVGGTVPARGRTDTERLTYGELVYCGVLRTNPDTLVQVVPVRGAMCRVTAELFSLMADVHVLLGNLTESDYSCQTADGRGPSQEEAHARLARLACSDSEALDRNDILVMARYIYEAQIHELTAAALQVLSALNANNLPRKVLAAGSGAFVAEEVGNRLGMEVVAYPSSSEKQQGAVLPALAEIGRAHV